MDRSYQKYFNMFIL